MMHRLAKGLKFMIQKVETLYNLKSIQKSYHQPGQFLLISFTNEPRSEKTSLRGFRPGPMQTGLHKH